MESSTKKRERGKRKRRNVLDGRKRVERTRGVSGTKMKIQSETKTRTGRRKREFY